MSEQSSEIVLRPISAKSAQAVIAAQSPPDVRVASDYPTEFSSGIAGAVGGGSPLGPYFLHRAEDDVVVGEIGGGFVSPGVVEIGYAIVASCWSRGYATGAVRSLVTLARAHPAIHGIVAHNPIERAASGRVLEKAGFTLIGEMDDEHAGQAVRVQCWELMLESRTNESSGASHS